MSGLKFGGVSGLKFFLGGGVWSEIFGGGLKFFSFFSKFLFPKNILLGCTHPPPLPETVNARPVRILLECILVSKKFCFKMRWSVVVL